MTSPARQGPVFQPVVLLTLIPLLLAAALFVGCTTPALRQCRSQLASERMAHEQTWMTLSQCRNRAYNQSAFRPQEVNR